MMQSTAPDDIPLPKVRGKITFNAPLADTSWFRVGGCADILYRPADVEDLCDFLKNLSPEIPVTTIAVGSNLLIRDGGVAGVVIRLPPNFGMMEAHGDQIHVGAAAIDLNVARFALQQGLTGMEFLCGIPGTIGGGLRMNAGAYGREFKDVVISAKICDRQGTIHDVGNRELGFSYRHSNVAKDSIFISALLQTTKGDSGTIRATMDAIQKSRGDSQPIHEKTGGSTFANPENHKAWELIDAAGCRGLAIGGAKVSDKHCNFLINTGTATAKDIEDLGEEVRRRVKEKSGIDLRWEIQRIGRKVGT